MKILVIGATGTLGREVVRLFKSKHEVLEASRTKAALKVDIADPESIRTLFRSVGPVDAVVSVAGEGKFAPLDKLSDDDFAFSVRSKLMGQVNVVRFGLEHVRPNGSVTITSGILSHRPMPGSGAISLVNAGLEGFARAAALEAPRGIRVNVVSPPWAAETLKLFKMDPSQGRTAADIATLYAQAVEGKGNGSAIEFGR